MADTGAAASDRSEGVPLAIRADRLFDGVDGTPAQHASVLIEFGRGVAVLSGADPPPTARVIDLGAVTLPALIDSHVHTVLDASRDPVGHLDAEDEGAHHDAGQRPARVVRLCHHLRDLGDRDYLPLVIRDNSPPTRPPARTCSPRAHRSRPAAGTVGSSAARPQVGPTRSASTPTAA